MHHAHNIQWPVCFVCVGGIEVSYQALTVTNADGNEVFKTPRYGDMPHGEPRHERRHPRPEEPISIHQEESAFADETTPQIRAENPVETEQTYGLPPLFIVSIQ